MGAGAPPRAAAERVRRRDGVRRLPARTASRSRSTADPSAATRRGDLLRWPSSSAAPSAIDTDAHAPGQLAWQPYGAGEPLRCGVTPEMVINTRPVAELLT